MWQSYHTHSTYIVTYVDCDSITCLLQRCFSVTLINSSLAAIQLRFAPQNYTVTEGGTVNITLEVVPPSDGYDFNFTVTLQYMNGSAIGECALLQ